LNNLGAMAQQFYKKPVSMGGGGNAFSTANGAVADWSIPGQLDTTANGYYSETVAAQSVIITGTGTEKNDAGQYIQHAATITPTSITVTMVQ
jgi:hypothetical protein